MPTIASLHYFYTTGNGICCSLNQNPIPTQIQTRNRSRTSPKDPGRSQARGGRGYPPPPTPLPLFRSRWGSPSPPCAGPGGGYPPPHHVPAGACHTNAKIPPAPPSHDGNSTRNDGSGREKKRGFPAQGGRGVPPTPLPFFRSKWGSPSPPCAGPGRGYPPNEENFWDGSHFWVCGKKQKRAEQDSKSLTLNYERQNQIL